MTMQACNRFPGANLPSWIIFTRSHIGHIRRPVFLKPCGVHSILSDALDSSREQGSE
jgi:hypothetical protein